MDEHGSQIKNLQISKNSREYTIVEFKITCFITNNILPPSWVHYFRIFHIRRTSTVQISVDNALRRWSAYMFVNPTLCLVFNGSLVLTVDLWQMLNRLVCCAIYVFCNEAHNLSVFT